MQALLASKIESGVDRAASLLFAGAAAYAVYRGFGVHSAVAAAGAASAAAAGLAFVLCVRLLGAVEPEPRRLPVPIFDLRKMEAFEPPELLLTDRYEGGRQIADEALVLDDVLAEIGPDSRVVRLFDPAAMPTAGQLNERIERHLERGAPPTPSLDASQALHEALAQLRRSLR